jgi:glycerophosphoryl diester phosphodiesterase
MSRRPIVPHPGRPLVVGHRGASGTVPENTLAALELAIDQGADIVEIDAQLTADGELVVIHDDTLERTTDAADRLAGRAPWNVRDHTLAEIRRLSAGEWDGERLPVPTLREVIDLVRDRDAGLLIETKAEHVGEALEPAIGALVRGYDDWRDWVPDRLMVGSFQYDSLLRARHELPGVNLAFILVLLVAHDGVIVEVAPATPGLVEPGVSLTALGTALAADGVGYLGMALMGENGEPVDDFTAATVERFRSLGVEINFITDDPATMRSLAARGVTSVLTNHPDRLVEVLAGLDR